MLNSSERERMRAGAEYNSRDPELLALAHRARALCAQYAALSSTDAKGRLDVLRALLGEVGEGVWIEPPFFCDYGAHIHIGADSFLNANCVLLDSADIRIGRNTLLGPGVQLLTATHPLSAAERIVPKTERAAGQPAYRTQARPITIGDNVWLGANVVVLPGVTIGDNVTVGAGSVVTRDIPSDVLALGQPCRVVRDLP
jgi:maltose O-acetyltransferase